MLKRERKNVKQPCGANFNCIIYFVNQRKGPAILFELCPRIFVQPITAQFAVLKLAEQNNSWAVID